MSYTLRSHMLYLNKAEKRKQPPIKTNQPTNKQKSLPAGAGKYELGRASRVENCEMAGSVPRKALVSGVARGWMDDGRA